MEGMLRALLFAGTIGVVAGFSPAASADAALPSSGGQSIVWRISTDGDRLFALPTEQHDVLPAPLRKGILRPSYQDMTGTRHLEAGPALVLRLDAGPSGSVGADSRHCNLPLWLSLSSSGACLGQSTAMAGGLSASLDWIGDGTRLAVRAESHRAPMPIGGSLSMAAPTATGTPTNWPLIIGGSAPGQVAVERYAIDGGVRLGQDLGLRWAAGIASVEPVGAVAGADRGFDQQSLSLGLARGAWSGGLTGRLTRPRPASEALGDTGALDVEVAWVTPWDGELSFGAENLIVRESDFKPSVPTTRTPPAPARTPFVRYRQDF
jgi:hypothetical protein